VTVLDAILLLSSLHPSTAQRYAGYIEAEAARHKIDPLLVVALIHHESRFQKRATSGGNFGLLQLRVSPTNYPRLLGHEYVLYRPSVNIKLGVALLEWWRDYHRRRCGGPHHWWSHWQWGKVVKNRGSGDRVAATLRRLLGVKR
jgi:soluble lytic murein transglycosylase-like protein